MTAKFSLREQLEEVEREIRLRKDVYTRAVAAGHMRQAIADYHLGRMEGVLATLGWLSDNEQRIKAKVEFLENQDLVVAMPEPLPASGRVYKQQATMFLDMAKGGYLQIYNVRDGEAVIGVKTVRAETRNAAVTTSYQLGDVSFDNVAEFIAAYEAGLGAPKAEGEVA